MYNLRKMIYQTLLKFNIQLVTKKITFYEIEKKKDNCKVVEFLGPSGVGKSFLLEKIVKKYNFKKKVINLSQDINSRKNRDLTAFEKKILQSRIKKYFSNDSNYVFTTSNKITRYISKIEAEPIVSSCSSISMWDEGLIYYFNEEIVEFYALFEKEIIDILNSRIIVNLIDNPENIYKKIMIRKKNTGNIHSSHVLNTKKDIYLDIEKTINKNNLFCNFFGNLFPDRLITIDLSNNITDEEEKLYNFLDKNIFL